MVKQNSTQISLRVRLKPSNVSNKNNSNLIFDSIFKNFSDIIWSHKLYCVRLIKHCSPEPTNFFGEQAFSPGFKSASKRDDKLRIVQYRCSRVNFFLPA